jgi:hypothetical protein
MAEVRARLGEADEERALADRWPMSPAAAVRLASSS